jgi:DNA polymerase III subunit beta
VKLRADRATLAAAASDTARALPTRPSVPILNGMLLDADADGRVTLTAYDFDTAITTTLSADVLDAGRVLIPGRRFADFLSAMPAGPVELDDSAGRLAVTMPRVRYGLATMTTEDYPGLPPIPPLVGTVDAGELTHAVGKVAPHARPMDGLWFSQHLALKVTNAALLVYATDRYTIGLTAVEWSDGAPQEAVEVAVSVRSVTDALRNLAGPVGIHLDDTGFALTGTDRTVLTRRSSEPYLAVQAVLDRRPPGTTTVHVRADELADAMHRCVKVADTKERTPVRITVGPDGLRYTATGADGGADGDLDLATFDGEPIEIGVNPGYMVDCLKPFGDATVGILLGPGMKPLVVRDPELSADVQVIMPIRLPGQ